MVLTIIDYMEELRDFFSIYYITPIKNCERIGSDFII